MKKIFLIGCILSFTMLFASCSKDENQIPSSTGAVTSDQVEKLDEEEPISEMRSLKFYRSPNEEYVIAFPEEWVKDNEPIFDEDNNLNLSIEEGTEDYGDEYEKVDGEILEKYREIEQSGEEIKIVDLKRMENEIINLQLYEIMDMTEENMYIVQESPLSVSKMILYGLTTQPAVLEATVYDKEAKLSALKEYIPDFQGQIAKNYDNFKLSTYSANEYNNEYFVYVNLDEENCDMQVLIEFREIHGRYYFERFKPI